MTSGFTPANTNQLVRILDLNPHRQNFIVDALVIAKTAVRNKSGPAASTTTTDQQQKQLPSFFHGSRPQHNSTYVFNFTIRDSISGFVNVTCWSDSEELSRAFRIGDIVRVVGSRCIEKPSYDEDRYAPPTPVPVELKLSSPHGHIKVLGNILGDKKTHQFATLACQPIRDPNDYYTLAQIIRIGQKLEGVSVNLLVVVKTVGKERKLKFKDGREGVVCECRVLDKSCTDFCISLWDTELIAYAHAVWPRNVVVFFTDIKMSYDEKWHKGMVGKSTSQTVAIPNPICPDAAALRELINEDMAATFQNEAAEESEWDVSMIRDQFTSVSARAAFQHCLSVVNSMKATSSGAITFNQSGNNFQAADATMTGYMFGYLTGLPQRTEWYAKEACANCGRFLEPITSASNNRSFNDENSDHASRGDYYDRSVPRQCPDSRCRIQNSNRSFLENNVDDDDENARDPFQTYATPASSSSVWRYRLMVDFSDDLGTLRRLAVNDRAGRKFLGMSADDFMALDELQRAAVKWRLLFEKFKVFFKIQPSQITGKLNLVLLDLEPADPREMCGMMISPADHAMMMATATTSQKPNRSAGQPQNFASTSRRSF